MTRALGLATIGTLFTFAMTTLGAASVFLLDKRKKSRSRAGLLGFAAGVMTAASVWSLLLPAIEQARELALPAYLPAAAGVASGAVFLAALDALALRLRGGETDARRRSNALLFTAITLHNIPEGMAVGLAFALAAEGEGLSAAAALAFGIGVQNFPEGAAISLPMREMGCSRARSFIGGTLSGAVEPLFGVLAALGAVFVRRGMPWLLSFAAGAMLYVVVVELVPQSNTRGGVCGYMTGFLVMMTLDVALS
ncbi:MAG: ZIP family metal transporter [Oscillospiraceae bacterium]|nr:ZIP family metal transporter [Oscillospiraceae bacterium]